MFFDIYKMLPEECEGCAKATRDCIADLQESIVEG